MSLLEGEADAGSVGPPARLVITPSG